MAKSSRHANIQGPITKNRFELEAWSTGNLVCGIDEVGRGCLAGPLVTAAVILPAHKTTALLKDSKLLTESARLKAYAWIMKHCWYGVGMVHHRLIDQHNIYQATLIAMKKAVVHALTSCPQQPQTILTDAMPLQLADTSYKGIPVFYFPEGERKSSSIAAASIVAKVRRDALMTELGNVIHGYHFQEHKGYSTAKHQESLHQKKYSIVHRVSFLSTFKPENPDHGNQQSFC